MKPTLYTNEKLPDWWWLNPWKHARNLHKAMSALLGLIHQQDDLLRQIRQDNRTLTLAAKHRTNRIAVLESQVREYRDARNEGK